jgi:hypothetical protein
VAGGQGTARTVKRAGRVGCGVRVRAPGVRYDGKKLQSRTRCMLPKLAAGDAWKS